MAEKEYIEREALIKDLTASGTVGVFGLYKIYHFPAADVAPVRHGHWIRVKGIIQCDICGFGLFPDGYFFENGECTHSNEQDYRLNFCPNCGAKMDKES